MRLSKGRLRPELSRTALDRWFGVRTFLKNWQVNNIVNGAIDLGPN